MGIGGTVSLQPAGEPVRCICEDARAWEWCWLVFPASPASSLKGWQIVAVGEFAAGERRPRNRSRTDQPTLKGSNNRLGRVCDPFRVELVCGSIVSGGGVPRRAGGLATGYY